MMSFSGGIVSGIYLYCKLVFTCVGGGGPLLSHPWLVWVRFHLYVLFCFLFPSLFSSGNFVEEKIKRFK